MARANEEIKVGVVVAVSALLFLVALVFVGGANLLRQKKIEYTAYFKFAGGLEPGSLVRFGGFKVGTIKSASLDTQDPTRIRIILQVDPGTPVKAQLQGANLLARFPGGELSGDFRRHSRRAARCRRGARFPPWRLSNWPTSLIT